MAIAIAVPSVTLSNSITSKKWLIAIVVSAQRFFSFDCAHRFGLDIADQPYSRKGYCGLFLHPLMIS